MQFSKSPNNIHRFFKITFVLNLVLYAVLGVLFLWNPSPAEVGAAIGIFLFALPSLVLFLISLVVFLVRLIRSQTFYLFEVLVLLTSPLILILVWLAIDAIATFSLPSSQEEYEVFEETEEPTVLVETIPEETISEETVIEEPEKVPVVQTREGEEQLSPYIIRKITCDTELCWYREVTFLDLQGNVYPVPAGTVNSAGDGWVYMDNANQIFTYDVLTGESQLLMSVLDTTDGVSFEWSPDDSKLAIVVVNQGEESYLETYGSKLFMFSFDAEGKMLQKDRYLFKIKYGCHDAGCDSIAGEDFYFIDNDTFVYYTWEGDPYVERTEEFKRTVEL